MWRRWNERGSLGWFELRTRAGVYVLLAAVPVLAVVLAAGQHQVRVPGLAVFLLLSVAQAGVCIALLHAGLGRYLAAGPPPDRWLVASAAALTAAGVLAGAAAFPAFTQPPGTAFPVSMLVAMLFGGALICGAHAPAQPARADRPGPGERGRGQRLDREHRPGRRWRLRAAPHRGIPGLHLHRRHRRAHLPRVRVDAADHVRARPVPDRARPPVGRRGAAALRPRPARRARPEPVPDRRPERARRGAGAPGRPGRRRADAPGAPGGP